MSTQGPPPTQPVPPVEAGYPPPQPGAGGRFERGPAPGYEQPPAGYPAAHYGHDDGPGFAERAGQVARQWRTPETKEFFKTSEFLVGALTSILVLLAAALIGGGGGDGFTGDRAWMYVTILASAYMISRGLSKSGTRAGRDR